MTEQIEDEFWATARTEDAASRGRQADPSACGTCRDRVKAGGQVEHDGCAQRAVLLPAPDSPGYELLTGMSEEELAALPPRFHVPAYMESSSPKMWVCAVCWGDGWVSQWPCKTAVKHGLRVFTPEHEAETATIRQATRIAELEAEVAQHVTANLEAANRAQQEIDRLRTELKKYVGAEPTIAEEMAHLSHCLHAVYDVCDEAVRQATRWENPLPIPEWVETVRAAADGLIERKSYPPTLPWAQLMDEDDLAEFLQDITSTMLATTLDARLASRAPGPAELAALEKVCATWRLIAEAQHAHNTAPGPDDAQAELTRLLGLSAAAILTTPEQRQAALEILQQLVEREDDHCARAWMIGMNPHLNDLAPLHAIADGRADEARSAAQAYLDGAWT